MKALVLDRRKEVHIEERPALGPIGPDDVRIRIHMVGICGSDVHYYTHGRIGPYVVEQPMVLGHEASGTIVGVGAGVTHLRIGDRVCMEPGIPRPNSRASKLGIYNVDPDVRFWATPPVDGCLIEQIDHPAAYTYKLPDNVSFSEGAMVEPLAIGLQAATKARIRPGDTAAVIGAGTIGIMTALAALAGGAAGVVLSDLSAEKLAIAAGYPGILPCNIADRSLSACVADLTDGWGADVVFECSGSNAVYDELMATACPGGAVVLVGIPNDPVPFDVAAAQAKELRFESIFRYANMYERAIALIASGRIDLKPLVGPVYTMESAVEAFRRAAEGRPADIKLQISLAPDPAFDAVEA